MTRNAHIAVVGAGIIGVALADELVRRGASVTILDSGPPGAGTSGSSLAWLNSNEKLPRHYHDLSVRGIDAWRDTARGFGRPSWHLPTGSLTWAGTDTEREALGRRLARLRDWGYPAEDLTAQQAADREPALRIPPGAHVAFFPAEGFLHGGAAVDALLARARAGGARLRVVADDVTFEVRGSRVVAARLPYGELVPADVFVACAGWRTPRLFEPLGLTIPLVAADEAGSAAPCLITSTSGPAPIRRVINAPRLSLRPLRPRGLRLEAADVNDVIGTGTPPADRERLGADLVGRARATVAGFEEGEARHRLCIRPLPVDGHPIVGWLPQPGNVYVSVTHSGMTLGAVLAKLSAAEILDGAPGDDLRAYRPTRFFETGER